MHGFAHGRIVDQGPTFEILRNRRTLAKADLVPPQIIDISMSLSLTHPHLANTPIGHANTLNEMEAAVAGALGMPERATAVPTYAPYAPGAEDAAEIKATPSPEARIVAYAKAHAAARAAALAAAAEADSDANPATGYASQSDSLNSLSKGGVR